MDGTRRDLPLFGDQLAHARLAWVRRVRHELAGRGFDDFRRSDTGVVRTLLERPRPVGELATTLTVSRQAARKFVSGLEARGLVATRPDGRDRRRLLVTLTPDGRRFARAVVDTVRLLDDEVRDRCDPDDLAAARAVLRAVTELAGAEARP